MTRKDFELIAAVLRQADKDGLVTQPGTLAWRFADELAKTNPRFDRDRFILAATK